MEEPETEMTMLADIIGILDDIDAKLDQLTGAAGAPRPHRDQRSTHPVGGGAPRWAQPTSEPEQEQLAELDQWVRWYVDHYDAWTTIRPCWNQHPGVVEELSALRRAHQAAYADTAAAHEAAIWHDTAERAVARVSEELSLCRARECCRRPNPWPDP